MHFSWNITGPSGTIANGSRSIKPVRSVTAIRKSRVKATSDVASKIWLNTPPITQALLDRLDTIQLTTISQNENPWASKEELENSWFELVVYRSWDRSRPRINLATRNELSWRSHSSPAYETEDGTEAKGVLFQRGDEILEEIEEGDALEDFQTKSKVPVEVDKRAADRVNEPTQWGGKYSLEKHALSILSLDGGGVRGLSSLLILKAIMEHIHGLNGETLMPYQCFDLIVGTSTGGLIAIMLGRLQMSVDDCIKEYCDLAFNVFGGKPVLETYEKAWGYVKKYYNNAVNFAIETIPKYSQLASKSHMYSGDKLKAVIQDVVKRRVPDQNPDAQMLDTSTGCHVAVFACRAKNINNERAQHLRTYPLLDDKSHSYKIWEAARATTAAPAYFERITAGGDDYVDGGLQVNNPILAAAIEGRAAFGQARSIGCTLSLGTGRPPDMALSDSPGIVGTLFNLRNLAESLVSLATNSELLHLNVLDLNKQNIFPGEYFRFNATVDIPTQGDPKFRDKMIGLDDVASLPKFRAMTEEYLRRSDVQQVIKQCAGTLNNLYHEKHIRS